MDLEPRKSFRVVEADFSRDHTVALGKRCEKGKELKVRQEIRPTLEV